MLGQHSAGNAIAPGDSDVIKWEMRRLKSPIKAHRPQLLGVLQTLPGFFQTLRTLRLGGKIGAARRENL
jgi:hypothetical protein